MPYNLYACFCGPQEIRQNRGQSHQGYIYENCPAKTAPALNVSWDTLKDFRVKILKDKLDIIITILQQHGATKAHLIGSMVQNQSKSSSDIDIVVDIETFSLEYLKDIAKELTNIIGFPVDIVTYSFLNGFPHNALDKASLLLFNKE